MIQSANFSKIKPMLQKLKEYVEDKKVGVHFEPKFSGFLNFTRESGRIVLCNVANTSLSYYRPSSKTFWVQQAGSVNILATWNGRYYLTQDESILVEVVDDLFNDETTSIAPYSVPEKFLQGREICEILTFALLEKDVLQKYSLTPSNATDWYCQQDRDEDWLSVSWEKIHEFLETHCEYAIDQDSWCTFSRKGISGFLRLPVSSENDSLEIAFQESCSQSKEFTEFLELSSNYYDGLLV